MEKLPTLGWLQISPLIEVTRVAPDAVFRYVPRRAGASKMARALRWAGYAFASIFGLVLIAVAAIWLLSSSKLNARAEGRPEHLAQPTPAQQADIEREARSLGCFSCHGEGLRGNKMFDQPLIGTVWAPNLTLVAAHASDQQLARAIRQGIGVDGRSLFVMPSEAFQHLSDQEVTALVAMIRGLPARERRRPAIRTARWGGLVW